jgi:hypothetical protein
MELKVITTMKRLSSHVQPSIRWKPIVPITDKTSNASPIHKTLRKAVSGLAPGEKGIEAAF